MPFVPNPADYQCACFNGGGGNPGAGYNLNDHVDYVDCGNAPILSPANGFSFAAWVKKLVTNAAEPIGIWTIASQWEWGPNNLGRWSLHGAGPSNYDRVYLIMSNGIGQDATAYSWLGANHVLADDTWVHVGFTYSGSAMHFYINGVEDSGGTVTGTLPAALITSQVHLELGRWHNQATGTAIPGPEAIRGVKYYGRVLTSGEMVRLAANQTISGTGILLDLPLNGSYTDVSGNGNVIAPFSSAPCGPAMAFASQGGRTGPATGRFQVHAFGDSITYGTGWIGGWRINFFAYRWRFYGKPVRIVGQQTDSSPPSYWTNTHHDGVPGEQFRGQTGALQNPAYGIIARVDASISAHHGTDLYVLTAGINDIGHGCTAVQARDNAAACIEQIMQSDHTYNGGNYTTPLLLVGPPTYLGGVGTAALVALLPAMVSAINSGATTWPNASTSRAYPNVTWVPGGANLNNPYDFQTDATHPTRKGYDFMGAAIAAAANQVLNYPAVTVEGIQRCVRSMILNGQVAH